MQGRAQDPNIPDAVPLDVSPVPGSTYVRPAVTQPGNDLLRISSTLGSLSPALAQLGQTIYANNQKQAVQDVQANEPLKSHKEIYQDYKNLPPITADNAAGIAQSKIAGQAKALDAQNDMTADLASQDIDWKNFDPSAYVAGRAKDYAAMFEGNPYAKAAFNEGLAGFPAKIMSMRTQGMVAQTKQTSQDNVFGAMKLAAEKTIAGGGTDDDGNPTQKAAPEDVAKALWNEANAVAGPKGSQGISFNDANKYAIQIAKGWVADGKNLDEAVALLSNPRAGQGGGPDLPPLINTAQDQAEVQGVIKAATAAKAKAAKQAALQNITSQDAQNFSNQNGKLATVGDITYQGDDDDQPKVVASATRQTNAIRYFNTVLSPQIAKANNETPQQTFNREFSVFANGGVANPAWKSALDAAPLGASLNELTNPQKRDQLLSAADLYQNLKQKNPLYLNGLVEKQTRDFFDAMQVAQTLPSASGNGGLNTAEEAADMARRAAINPQDDDELKGKFKDIAQKVSSATPASGFWESIFGSGPPINAGYVQGLIMDRARLFARLGLSADQAISQATEAVRNTSVKVNNWVVPNLGKTMPADFPQAAGSYISDFVKNYGALNNGISANDVGIAADGRTGAFTLTNGQGYGLRTPTGIAHFTLRDLAGYRAQQVDDTRNDVLAKAQSPKQQQTLSAVKDPATRQILQEFYTGGNSAPMISTDTFGNTSVASPPPPSPAQSGNANNPAAAQPSASTVTPSGRPMAPQVRPPAPPNAAPEAPAQPALRKPKNDTEEIEAIHERIRSFPPQ